MRTFIAIDLDDKIKQSLSSLIQELDKVSTNIKWVKKEAMHLTLKFLGEIALEKISEIKAVLEKICRQYDGFSLKLKGTGSFPPGKKPRVLWVGVEESSNIKSLQARIEQELENLGFAKEKREFHPHLTLGRVKPRSHLGGVPSKLSQKKQTDYGEMKVKKITFFQSILKPTGAEYKIISEFELK
ncbi:MAG: RNA 2',3'-cyclic phosphodiesterase [Candidatus Aminicenantes bacterium]